MNTNIIDINRDISTNTNDNISINYYVKEKGKKYNYIIKSYKTKYKESQCFICKKYWKPTQTITIKSYNLWDIIEDEEKITLKIADIFGEFNQNMNDIHICPICIGFKERIFTDGLLFFETLKDSFSCYQCQFKYYCDASQIYICRTINNFSEDFGYLSKEVGPKKICFCKRCKTFFCGNKKFNKNINLKFQNKRQCLCKCNYDRYISLSFIEQDYIRRLLRDVIFINDINGIILKYLFN